MRAAVLGIRFLTELGALAALGVWGFGQNVVAGIAAPVLAGAVWARYVAPRSQTRLADPLRFVVELFVFGAATAALIDIAVVAAGLAFGAVAVVIAALARFVADELRT